MNANELADYLDSNVGASVDSDNEYIDKASAMLRQQQAEIEALKLQLHTMLTNRDLRTYDGKLGMNNEPVAWINLDRFKDEALYLADCVSENQVENMGITTPLYTHSIKELTDEEIDEVLYSVDWAYDPVAFARAILRKAQEK
jgi:hypothetical protein